MKTTDITAKDSELDVIFGDFAIIDKPREQAYGSLKYLYTDLTDIRKYYIRLGFHLDEFSRYEYYNDFGYRTLEEFCEVNLGLDKSAVSRCINVYRNFNASNDVSFNGGVKSTGCAMELSEQWKDFSYTQLCEMLPLSNKQRKMVRPEMTVSQIREYKKNLKQNKTDSPVASTQPEKKLFDYKKYDSSSGIVRVNAVRNCDPLKEDVVLTVFDKNGKMVYGNFCCDLIHVDNGHYFFRLWQADKDEDSGPE